MPVIPKPNGLGSTQNGEIPEDPIDGESPPSNESHATVPSQEPCNESQETAKEPVRLSLKSSKPATSLLSSLGSKLTTQPLSWIQSATKPISSFFSSSKSRTASSIPYPGLDNLGHTCYINSCTHTILLAPFFRDSLKSLNSRIEKYVYSRPGTGDTRFDSHVRLIREFYNLCEDLLVKYNKNKAINSFGSIRPLNYLHALSEVDNRYGAGSEQQDVQEFFVFLLSALDDGAKMLKEKIEKKELILEDSANETFLESLLEPSKIHETAPFEDSTSGSTVERENGSKKRIRPETEISSVTGDDNEEDMVPIKIGTGSPVHKKAKMEESVDPSLSLATNGSSSGTLLATTQELSDGFQLSYESQSMEEPKISEDSMDVDETSSSNISIGVGDAKSSKEVESIPADAENGATGAKMAGKEALLPHELFQGEITSTFQCVECERESGRPEAFFDISLPIEKGKSLYDSFGEHFSKHILRGQEKYECDTCRHMNEAFHYQRISKLPNVLTVHLKRFSWSGGMAHQDSAYGLRPGIRGNGVGKLNFHIDCPFDLEIPRSWLSTKYQQEFLHQSSTHSSLHTSSDGTHLGQDSHMTLSSSSEISLAKSLVLHSRDIALARYQLYGIIYHSGSSTTFGHYTAAIRIPDEEETENVPNWALFDDHSVSAVSHAWVMQSISEKSPMSGTAYILLYKRLFQ